MKWLAWVGCACVALVTIGACSGDEDKKVERGEDGGAAGDVSTTPGGGGQAPSAGGEGGVPTIPSGGAPVEAGAGGVAEAGAGGEGGVPSAELSIESLQGTWSGRLLPSYVCESSVARVQLTIEGTTVTSSWPAVATSPTGEVEQQAGRAFTFGLVVVDESLTQDYRAQLFVHPSGQYALVVLQSYFETGVSPTINLALLQKAEPSETDPPPDALLGDWQGTGIELDGAFEVVDQFESSGSFVSTEGMVLSGTDRDGAFGGIVVDGGNGWSAAPDATQDPNQLGIMTLTSDDEKVLAVAMLRDLSEDNSALCNLDDPYADMSVHKFALWDKVID
jgi:hypothetical protein